MIILLSVKRRQATRHSRHIRDTRFVFLEISVFYILLTKKFISILLQFQDLKRILRLKEMRHFIDLLFACIFNNFALYFFQNFHQQHSSFFGFCLHIRSSASVREADGHRAPLYRFILPLLFSIDLDSGQTAAEMIATKQRTAHN